MKFLRAIRRFVVGSLCTVMLLAGSLQASAQELEEIINPIDGLPPIIFPFPYDDLITLDPLQPFSYNFGSIDPELFQFTGYVLTSLLGEPLALEIISGFDQDLGINLDNDSIQERFVLIDGTLGLKLNSSDPNGGRRGIRINYRMDVRADLLRARYLGARVQARRDSVAPQWLRADTWLRELPAREGRMIDARLLRRNAETGRWSLAVDAVRGRATVRWMGDSEPDGVLGHHGYNAAKGYVWATLDVNSEYAVGINFDHDNDDIVNVDDNCPLTPNTDQANSDGADDGGDACDADDDNDTIADGDDNCPLVANVDQTDYDNDGVGFACETDDDGDGVFGGLDLCPDTLEGTVNADGCSVADLCPCDNGWKNHGKYVKCVAQTSEDLLEGGFISETGKDALVSAAGQSACGAKK